MDEADDSTAAHLVQMEREEAIIPETPEPDPDLDSAVESDPLKGARHRTGSAAQAVVASTLFSNPEATTITEETTKDFVSDSSPTEEDIKGKTNDNQLKKQKIKRYAKYVFLLLWIAYSLAAFIIDFQRAKILFIIEMILIGVTIIKLIYNRCCVGVPTRVCDSLSQNKIVVYIIYCVLILGALTVIILCTYEDAARLMALVGLTLFITACYILSWNRSAIKWRPVIWGFGLQFTFALLILRTEPGYQLFNYLGNAFKTLLNFTLSGSGFVFSYLATGTRFDTDTGTVVEPFTNAAVFACSVIPTVIFFSSLVSILYYLGVLQVIIYYLSVLMQYTLGTSSSESLNAAGNIFVGMTEAPLLIKPFLKNMTRSELHAVMTGGFATIAGGVMAIYIFFGVSASHLLSASVMSAPAALAISKIVYPEDEISPTAQNAQDDENGNSADKVLDQIGHGSETNVIEAAANGASIAVGLAANIAGMLIAFLGLVALLDYLFAWWGSLINWEITFTKLCGYIFYPVAVVMGIQPADALIAGELIGQKIVVNEFVAYTNLLAQVNAEGGSTISSRSATILIYALCGFSNFGSIGITLGGLTPLAPSRSKDLTQLVLSAMISGNVACFMTACIAALLFDPDRYD